MNRAERNTIREAASTLDSMAERVRQLEEENARLERSNRWLRARLNGLLRERQS